MIRMRESWTKRKARRAEKRRQRVWDAVNFEDTVHAWEAERTRRAVEREMQRQQLSQWDVPDDQCERIGDMLAEPGEWGQPQ